MVQGPGGETVLTGPVIDQAALHGILNQHPRSGRAAVVGQAPDAGGGQYGEERSAVKAASVWRIRYLPGLPEAP